MPDSVEWGLFLHIIGLFLVAGSMTAYLVILAMMRRADSVQDVRVWANLAAIVDKVVPLSLVVLLLTGVWLVEDAGFDWGAGWINVSFIALIVVLAAWLAFNTRKVVAIDTAAADAADGAVPQVLAAQITDPVLFGTTHAAITTVLAVIWNMTTHPGDAQAGVVVLAAVLIGAASAAPMVQRQQAILEGKR
jgi:uncharacterized membrane protein